MTSALENNTSGNYSVVIEETIQSLPSVVVQGNEENLALLAPPVPQRCCRISLPCGLFLLFCFPIATMGLLLPLSPQSDFDLSKNTKITLIALSAFSGLISCLGFSVMCSRAFSCCENRCTKWLWSWIKDTPVPAVPQHYRGG